MTETIDRFDQSELRRVRCVVVTELVDQGLSDAEIAAKLGCTERSVQRYKDLTGLIRRPSRPLTADEMIRIGELYDDGCPLTDIAETIGRKRETVSAYLRRIGKPPLRPKGGRILGFEHRVMAESLGLWAP